MNASFSSTMHGVHIKTTPRRRTLNCVPTRHVLRITKQDSTGATLFGTKRLGQRPEHKGGASR